MARAHIYLLCVSLCVSLVLVTSDNIQEQDEAGLSARSLGFESQTQPKTSRFLGNLLSILTGYDRNGYCPPNSCPPWRCQDDSAVIHGYCCGCGSPRDNVPFVRCRPDLRCPLSSEPLCTDYNFMLDCCCTGP